VFHLKREDKWTFRRIVVVDGIMDVKKQVTYEKLEEFYWTRIPEKIIFLRPTYMDILIKNIKQDVILPKLTVLKISTLPRSLIPENSIPGRWSDQYRVTLNFVNSPWLKSTGITLIERFKWHIRANLSWLVDGLYVDKKKIC